MSGPKLSHIHLKVNDLKAVVSFYQDLFDMQITEDLGSFIFLSNDQTHHILALQQSAIPFNKTGQKLYHIAFEVQTPEQLYDFAYKLESKNIPFQAVDHGISWAIYFNDPEQNGLELFLDRRSAPGGTPTWEGTSRRLVIRM